jgi:ribosomal protein L37AE/L43A
MQELVCFAVESYQDLLVLAAFVVILIIGQSSFLLPIYFFREQTCNKVYIPPDVRNPPDFPVLLPLDEDMLQAVRHQHMLSLMTQHLFDNDQKSHKTVRLNCFQFEGYLQIPFYVLLVQIFGVILIVFGWFIALANDDIRDAYKENGFGDIVSGNFITISIIVPIGTGINYYVSNYRSIFLPTFGFLQRMLFFLFFYGTAGASLAFSIIYYPYLILSLFLCVCSFLSSFILIIAIAFFSCCCIPCIAVCKKNTNVPTQNDTSVPNSLTGAVLNFKDGLSLGFFMYFVFTLFGMIALTFVLATAMTGGPTSDYSNEICIPTFQNRGIISLIVGIGTICGFLLVFALIFSHVITPMPIIGGTDYSNREYICPQCSDRIVIPNSDVRIFCCRNCHVVTCTEAFPMIVTATAAAIQPIVASVTEVEIVEAV